jgi:hypothetical protein
MPGRSALAAAIDPSGEWSSESCLIVELLDRLEIANWLAIEINSEDNAIPFPSPWPRPWVKSKDEEDEPEWATPAELSKLFGMNV